MKTFRLLANHTSTSGLVPALYCHHPLTPWDIHQSHCWISQPFSQSDCAPHWVIHGPANVDQQVQHLLPSRSARKGHQHLHPAAATSSPFHLKRRHPRDTGSHLFFHEHWTWMLHSSKVFSAWRYDSQNTPSLSLSVSATASDFPGLISNGHRKHHMSMSCTKYTAKNVIIVQPTIHLIKLHCASKPYGDPELNMFSSHAIKCRDRLGVTHLNIRVLVRKPTG